MSETVEGEKRFSSISKQDHSVKNTTENSGPLHSYNFKFGKISQDPASDSGRIKCSVFHEIGKSNIDLCI